MLQVFLRNFFVKPIFMDYANEVSYLINSLNIFSETAMNLNSNLMKKVPRWTGLKFIHIPENSIQYPRL